MSYCPVYKSVSYLDKKHTPATYETPSFVPQVMPLACGTLSSNYKFNIMKFCSLFFAALFSLLCTALNAQTSGTVTGTVTDVSGETLPGVSVVVKGTANGTITGIDGEFSLTASSQSVLQFSFVGYKSQDVKVGNQKIIKIVLEEESQSLDEVVVVAVGYGDVKRRDLTGAISKANMEDLNRTPVNNIAEALGGRIAGVNVSSSDGGLGDNFNFVIRGAGSLTQSTAPLFVIDGFPQESSTMSAFNSNDIESMEFLRDASATAIYGSRGANGVVIITTKKGKAGKPTVTYNGSMSVGTIRNKTDMMDGYQFVSLQKEVMDDETYEKYYGINGMTPEDYKNMKYYDWQDHIYRTAISHQHHVSLTGKSGDTNYATSLSYNDNQGIVIRSGLKRYQGRVNLTQKISNKLKATATLNYASTLQDGPTVSNNTTSMSTAYMYSVWSYRPVSPTGSDLLEEMYDESVNMAEDYRFNPVMSAQNEYRHKTTNNLQANASLEYEIIKGLKFKIFGGYTSNDYKNEEFNNSRTRTGNSNPKNTQSKGINAMLYQSESRNYLNENTLSYQYNKNRHNLTALAGITYQKGTSYIHSITTEQITSESFGMAGLDKGATPIVFSSKGENKLMSYLGRFTYNYNSLYYVTASFRADGSSKFAPGNRWGYFPSGSLAWAFGREAFMKEATPWLSNGKLRVSYGMTGNNRVGNYDYMAHLSTDNDLYKYPWDSHFNAGYVLNAMANEDLKWETTEQLDLGLDLGFLNDRISLTLDYYIKTTKDLLLSADVSASSGFKKATLNVGKLRNTGLEITLESRNIQTKNFSWNSSFNIAFNTNKILALNSGQTEMKTTLSWDNKYNTMPAYISKVGESAGKMYGYVYEGTYKAEDFNTTTDKNGKTVYTLKEGIPYISKDCQPGDPRYKNMNPEEDNVINDKDKVAIGNGQPKHTGGFTNNFTYKNFDLSIFLQWSYGNDILNANRLVFENPASKPNANMFASYADRWTVDNPTSNMPRARAIGSNEYSSLYVEDGSFLKLKNISLGYNLPQSVLKRIKISNARIYVSADNIATLTNYSGADPEVSTRNSVLTPGFDWSAYPRAFTASLGVNVTF